MKGEQISQKEAPQRWAGDATHLLPVLPHCGIGETFKCSHASFILASSAVATQTVSRLQRAMYATLAITKLHGDMFGSGCPLVCYQDLQSSLRLQDGEDAAKCF